MTVNMDPCINIYLHGHRIPYTDTVWNHCKPGNDFSAVAVITSFLKVWPFCEEHVPQKTIFGKGLRLRGVSEAEWYNFDPASKQEAPAPCCILPLLSGIYSQT